MGTLNIISNIPLSTWHLKPSRFNAKEYQTLIPTYAHIYLEICAFIVLVGIRYYLVALGELTHYCSEVFLPKYDGLCVTRVPRSTRNDESANPTYILVTR